LDAAEPATAPAGPEGAGAAEGLGQIEGDLRSGRIDVATAIDRLVERALTGAEALPPARRAELEAHAPRVYFLSMAAEGELDALAVRAGAAARVALRSSEGTSWRVADRLFLGYGPEDRARIGRAHERLAAGRAAYLNLEFEQAIETLSDAVADLDAAASALEDTRDLGDALLFLGASQAFAERTRAARRTFTRLHVQTPQIQPDPDTFNPNIIERYEQAAPRDRESPTAQIAVSSEPPGAIVYVDHVPQGRAPIAVTGLMGGAHTVRVTRPGATPYVEQLSLRRGGSSEINAFLQDNEESEGLAEAIALLAAAQLTQQLDPNGGEVASILGLDYLGLVRVAPASDGHVTVEVLVYDAARAGLVIRDQAAVPRARLEAGVTEMTTRIVERLVDPQQASDSERIPADGLTPIGPIEPIDEPSLAEQWWFWAAVVGGALLVGTTIAIIAASGGDDLGNERGGQVILEF
jgi:hypothetical protein